MKSRKRARSLPQPEECGVWLDASQLKKKCHQVVIPCTSSRFNPLSRRPPTDSVLVEFTQTKSPQPCTKQTSMYSFFSPAGNRNKPSCITDITTLANKTSSECENRNVQEVPTMMKPSPIGASVCLKQTYSESAENQNDVYLYNIHSNTEKPVSSGQNDEENRSLKKLENRDDHAGGFSNASIFRSQEKSLNRPTNNWATGSGSKYQNNVCDSSVSECLLEDYNKDVCFPPSQPESHLFTQDTQGNRVICHRFTSERRNNAPLQDKTNVAWDTRSPRKGTLQTVCEEASLHKMFTQDSEGNLVIKH